MCINVQKSARTLPVNWFHLLSGTSPFPGTKAGQPRRLLTWGRNLWRKWQFAVRLLWDGRVDKKRARKTARGATFQGMRDWFNQHGMQFNFSGPKIPSCLYVFSPTQGHFFWRGLLARQAILNMRWATPHCGLLSFHLCLQVTKLHVAKLIDQLTVIPSEFLTRWRSSPLCILQPDYLYHIDIEKVYVSSFHQLYWCFLRLSEILVGFKL